MQGNPGNKTNDHPAIEQMPGIYFIGEYPFGILTTHVLVPKLRITILEDRYAEVIVTGIRNSLTYSG